LYQLRQRFQLAAQALERLALALRPGVTLSASARVLWRPVGRRALVVAGSITSPAGDSAAVVVDGKRVIS
jgi:hypothetical protein